MHVRFYSQTNHDSELLGNPSSRIIIFFFYFSRCPILETKRRENAGGANQYDFPVFSRLSLVGSLIFFQRTSPPDFLLLDFHEPTCSKILNRTSHGSRNAIPRFLIIITRPSLCRLPSRSHSKYAEHDDTIELVLLFLESTASFQIHQAGQFSSNLHTTISVYVCVCVCIRDWKFHGDFNARIK